MSDKIIRCGHSDFPESPPTFIKRENSISICGSENDEELEISDDIPENWAGDATNLHTIPNEIFLGKKPDPLGIKQDNVPSQQDNTSGLNLNKVRNPKHHSTKQRGIKKTTIDSNEDKQIKAKRTNRRRKTIKAGSVVEKDYKCSFCSKTFTRKQSLISHENAHTGKRPHKCHLCAKTFAGACALRNHSRMHTKDQQHKCSVCEKKFLHKFQLDYHTREKHLPDTDPQRYFPCQLCNDKFKTYDLLYRHKIQKHRKNSATIFTCDHCQRTFKHRDKIVQHMKIHSGIKNYKCLHCSATFAQTSGKWSHERFCLFK